MATSYNNAPKLTPADSIESLANIFCLRQIKEKHQRECTDNGYLVIPKRQTQNGYTSKSYSSQIDQTTKSPKSSPRKASQYVSLTNPTF